ncbi:MAG: ABC transporter permease [Solirubrobacteraceae bacterium]
MPDTTPTAVPRCLPAIGPLLAAQIRYQVRLLLANGRTVAVGIAIPVIFLVATGHNPSASDVARDATFGLTLTAWNANGVRLVAARQAGVLKRWRATPLPRWCYLAGRITATVLVAVLAGAVTVAVAALLYNLQLTVSSALGVLVVFALGAAAWAAAATALTAAIPTVEAATPILTLIYFPLIILSGVLGTISEPHWLSTLASYLPAQPLITGATHALHHAHGTSLLPTRDIVVLAIWAGAAIAVAVATFRWEPRRATQRRAARTTSRSQTQGLPAGTPDTTTSPIAASTNNH